jgi:hypothetical protein
VAIVSGCVSIALRFFPRGRHALPVKARAVARGAWIDPNAGVIVLNYSGKGTLNDQGNGAFTDVGAKVIVNSNDPSAASPDALVFRHSQQVIAPADYLAACDKDPILRPGSLNVRFFNISNSEGDMIMDTRGLAELGLHDLQCHFWELEPKSVAAVLFNTAAYIFEKGPVIEFGSWARTPLAIMLFPGPY